MRECLLIVAGPRAQSSRTEVAGAREDAADCVAADCAGLPIAWPHTINVGRTAMTDSKPSFSRRRLLVGAGVGTAAVWAAPAITTLASASASGSCVKGDGDFSFIAKNLTVPRCDPLRRSTTQLARSPGGRDTCDLTSGSCGSGGSWDVLHRSAVPERAEHGPDRYHGQWPGAVRHRAHSAGLASPTGLLHRRAGVLRRGDCRFRREPDRGRYRQLPIIDTGNLAARRRTSSCHERDARLGPAEPSS